MIKDNTDYISYKAHLVADQDYEDMVEEICQKIEDLQANNPQVSQSDAQKHHLDLYRVISMAIRQYTQTIFQCYVCGRIYFEDGGSPVYVFSPDIQSASPVNTRWEHLASIKDHAWKGLLRGHWYPRYNNEPSGELFWGNNSDDQGYERFTEWELLEKRYNEVFQRLLDKDILRSSFLRKGDEMIHLWPPKDTKKE